MISTHLNWRPNGWKAKEHTRFLFALLFLSSMTQLDAQITGKTPDRGVYHPPLLVFGGDGESNLREATQPPQLQSISQDLEHKQLVLPLSPSPSNDHYQPVERSKESGQEPKSVTYEHLPYAVVSDEPRAEVLVKPGEEGNVTRPLVEITVVQSGQTKDGSESTVPSLRRRNSVNERVLTFADYVRGDDIGKSESPESPSADSQMEKGNTVAVEQVAHEEPEISVPAQEDNLEESKPEDQPSSLKNEAPDNSSLRLNSARKERIDLVPLNLLTLSLIHI